MSKLADNLNAEIVQGTVQSVAEAAQWLGYTYLYVRMMQNPDVYRVPPDEIDKDPVLKQFRVDLVSALVVVVAVGAAAPLLLRVWRVIGDGSSIVWKYRHMVRMRVHINPTSVASEHSAAPPNTTYIAFGLCVCVSVLFFAL